MLPIVVLWRLTIYGTVTLYSSEFPLPKFNFTIISYSRNMSIIKITVHSFSVLKQTDKQKVDSEKINKSRS